MNNLLPIFIILPLLAFVVSLFIQEKKEVLLSRIAFTSAGLQLMVSILYIIAWGLHGFPLVNIKELSVYRTSGYEYYIDFHFDRITAVYLIVGSILTFLITIYSRYYLHREKGYKRFFNTILFFYTGYNITILSGNLETLFIGWEILGISSFLLIAFYRERFLPVKNALKVFSVYRLGDLGIILGMWLCHHAWHENITFVQINAPDSHLHVPYHIAIVISLLFILSAIVKSAQIPFSSWLPRAMEGPTPSSAIFYSSLSVHIGVFLLLRTFPFWEHQPEIRILVILIGLVTSVVSSFSARVQSSIKAQVAYSSISQIGIIFIEVALGFETIALIHFVGNAFMRTYQLLVSPSAVTYLIREQFYHFIPHKQHYQNTFLNKLKNTFYVLSLKEWNLDSWMFHYLWKPIKTVARITSFIKIKHVFILFFPLYVLGILLWIMQNQISSSFVHYFPYFFALMGLLMVLKSFIERSSPVLVWILILMNHLWIALAISFNEHFTIGHVIMYLSGVIPSAILGYYCLYTLKTKEPKLDLDRFQGHSYEYPGIGLLFLLACLGLAGFPITSSFIGEDLIFSHIHEEQFILVGLVSVSFFLDGISLIRVYARLFLGPHSKTYHESALKTS